MSKLGGDKFSDDTHKSDASNPAVVSNKHFALLALAVASITVDIGDKLDIRNRTAGVGEARQWDAVDITTVTVNGEWIVAHTDTAIALVLRPKDTSFDTLALALLDANLQPGDSSELVEHSTSTGGGATWDTFPSGTFTVSAAIFDVFNHSTLALQLKLRTNGVINVKQFGAAGTGLAATDDLEIIKAAIVVARAVPTLSTTTGSAGGGFKQVRLPKGAYRLTDVITLAGINGIEFVGDGKRATTLILDGTSKTMFFFAAYLNIRFSGITFMTGAVTDVSGQPEVDIPDEGSRTNICMSFNGSNGGTNFVMDDCDFRGFSVVKETILATQNDDGHVHNNCGFQNNDIVWNNLNGQAVIWEFNNCQMFFNRVIFKNPGTILRVIGGDYINPGDFYSCDGISQLGGQLYVDGARFENFQNLDPSESPTFLKLASGSYPEIVFKNISNVGGGDISAKTVYELAGSFDISFYNCNQRGKMEIDADTSSGGLLSRVTFHDCPITSPITQTLFAGQGNRPVTIVYDNSGADSRFARLNRHFANSIFNSPTTTGSRHSEQDIQTQFTLNNSSGSVEVPIFVTDKYTVMVVGAKIIHTRNGGTNYTINLWQDNTKSVLLFSKLITNDTNTRRITEITNVELGGLKDIVSTSPNLLLEFTTTGNSGTITANTYLKLGIRA